MDRVSGFVFESEEEMVEYFLLRWSTTTRLAQITAQLSIIVFSVLLFVLSFYMTMDQDNQRLLDEELGISAGAFLEVVMKSLRISIMVALLIQLC